MGKGAEPAASRLTVIAPEVPTEIVFYGTLEPRFVSGTGNGLDPSHFEFNKEAGTLIASKEEAPVTTSKANSGSAAQKTSS